ncbi:hypothetical protein [Paenibacillus sp. DCT19]|uniref:hypothetical protein n=1 Tax=Paenibacillus sp. DCT19 TaxID=2211212 RepID=UPI000FE1C0AC|nr:hypothetical protein [Paenibacillus sp. DCT19]
MLKRNIKFPIRLKNGQQVRTLEELKANFEIETVIEYYLDGRLVNWLEQRYYTKEAQLLQNLNENSDTLPLEISNMFGVDFNQSGFNYQEYTKKRAKLEVISKYTSDQVILSNNEYVAESQTELQMLYEKITDHSRTLYLLNTTNEIFNISDELSNITYIGINNPTVNLIGNHTFDASGKRIVFQNVKLTADKDTKFKSSVDSNFDCDRTKIKNHMNISELTQTIKIDGSKFKRGGLFNLLNRDFKKARKVYMYENVVMVELENVIAIYETISNHLLGHYKMYEYEHCVNIIKDNNKMYCLDIEVLNDKIMGAISHYKLLTLDSNKPMKRPVVEFNPKLHFRDMRVNLIGIHEEIMYLYSVNQNVNNSDNLTIQSCQVNLYNGSLKKDKRIECFNVTNQQSPVTYHFSNGKFYYFIPSQRTLMELNNQQMVVNLSGSIGDFVIRKNQLFALRSHPKNDRGIQKEYKSKYGEGAYKACSDSLVDIGELIVIDIESGSEINRLKAHEGEIDILKIYEDVLLTCSSFIGEVKLWDSQSFELLSEIQVAPFDFNSPLAFDVDLYGDQLAVLIEDEIYIYS